MIKRSRGPTFLICGAAQSGTSFLAEGLRQHPDVFMPRNMRPEPHYFFYNEEFAKPVARYIEENFSDVADEEAIGEKSSSYMFGRETAKRIKQSLGMVKLIFLLRNPIERAYANYRASALHGLEALTFDQALRREHARTAALAGRWAETRPFSYVARSLYFEQVARYLEHFDRSVILLLRSEDMFRQPQEIYARCFEFVGVDGSFTPRAPDRHSSCSVRDRVLQIRARKYFGGDLAKIVDELRKGREISMGWKSQYDLQWLLALKENLVSGVEPMSVGAREEVRDGVKGDVGKLHKVLGFPVDEWN